MGRVVVVVGSGTVAGAICTAIASSPISIDRVIVLGRSSTRVSALCAECNLVAGASRSSTTFAAAENSCLEDSDELSRWLDKLSPIAVVVASSLHSPTSLWGASDRWADLLNRAGFGVTVALQAINALVVGQALAKAVKAPTVINLCYPDVVNTLLSAVFLSPCWGAGNVMTIEASWRSQLALPAESDLALVGTHAALSDPSYVRGWVGSEEVRPATGGPVYALPPRAHRASLGVQVRTLLWSLVTGAELNVSMPGACGRPGGRPVKIVDRNLELRTAGLDDAESTILISAGLAADGISNVTSEVVEFAGNARAALEEYALLRPFADGVPLEELRAAAEAFSATRSSLQGSGRPLSASP